MARTCDSCGGKMAPYRPRKKNEEGKYECEGCSHGREGRPLTGAWIRAQAHMTPDAGGLLIKVAHGNQDGVTVFHCPFCGSGQVVNSGTAIECGFCHTNFSVLVQPTYAMMPQTVDGQPYTPGQTPGGPAPAPANAPGGAKPPPDDEGSFGGDQLSEKVETDGGDDADKPDDGNPFAKKDDKSDGDKPKDDDKDKNPFGKESFVTAAGVALPFDKYLDHLALQFSPDRQQTLAEVQRSHREV